MQMKITTTGTVNPVVFTDLGGRSFIHPTVAYDILTEYTLEEINNSNDFASAITAGEITVQDESGDPIEDTTTPVVAPHTHSGGYADSQHFHQTVNSATFALGTTITIPFDVISMDDGASPRFSILNGELECLIGGKILFGYTATFDNVTTSRTTGMCWLEADPGGLGVWSELANSRGYTYNRTSDNGEGSTTFIAPYTMEVGDKFRLRASVHQGVGTLYIVAIGTHGMAIAVNMAGPQGTPGSGSTIVTQDEGVTIANAPHDTIDFVGAGVDVSEVGGKATVDIPGSASPHTIASHSDTTATGIELEELTGGSQTSLHTHPTGASGLVVQMLYDIMTKQSGTSQIPADTTVPTNTEGTLVWSRSITPGDIANKVRVQASFEIGYNDPTNREGAAVTVFRGTTCIGAVRCSYDRDIWSKPISIDIIDAPATAAPTTYSIRVGSLTATATWYAGRCTDDWLGAVTANSGIVLTELAI